MKKFAYTIAFGMILGVVTSAQAVTVNTEFQYADGFSEGLQKAVTDDSLITDAVYQVTDQTDDSSDSSLLVRNGITINTDNLEDLNSELVFTGTSSGTVSSCPSGTTKSSDGCCCVNN